ncbi:MAG: hypothetical protein HYX57_09165 [Chloroflexi bacterium]|nr:hypothetical protein [Chloroflexota bacterium]
MSQALYEQYKDALRRGHVAALRDRLDAAAAAYRAAAELAPDRALPYASLAGVLVRQGRGDEALVAFDAALQRAPADEGALRGRAELHAAAGRRVDAATDFEVLAAALEQVGRTADAADAARRALELAESRSRRHELERLTALLRTAGEDRPAVEALDRALGILDPGAPAGKPEAGPAETESPIAGASLGPPREVATGTGTATPPDDAAMSSAAAGPPKAQDPAVLRAVADALLDAGDLVGAGDRFLALAATHRGLGQVDAAMDACLALLAATPSDPRLQLEIAAIQVERGWSALASEKVRLLVRLADLEADETLRAGISAFAVEHGLEVPAPAP